MRHKTFKQTNETYTDVRLLPTVEAIRMLPGLDGGAITQIDSHGNADMQEVVAAWPVLTDPLKAAVLAIVRTACGKGGGHGQSS